MHNQRIERLWRDVFGGCICLFYELFHDMEYDGLLNPDDDSQLWCLHFVFIPIINRHNWREAYIQHSLRTEHKTRMQLWISGLSEAWGSFSAEDLCLQVEIQSLKFGESFVGIG